MENIIIRFKGRKLDLNKSVKVYRCLQYRKERVYSIKQGNYVVAHTKRLSLFNVKFHVSEKGRQRVLKRKIKSVHAYAEGFIIKNNINDVTNLNRVTYNPYKNKNFI